MKAITPELIRPVVRVAKMVEPSDGMIWGPRIISDPELILVISGELSHQRMDSAVTVRAGQVLLIDAGVEHRLEVLNTGRRTIMPCIHFEPLNDCRYQDKIYSLEPKPAEITETSGDYIVRDLFVRCASIFQGYSRYREALLSAVFSELWVRLSEIWAGGGDKEQGPRLRAMLSFIRRNLSGDMSRRALSVEFGITPQHVNALFKKELGVTPSEFVNRERVYRASRLMAEEGLSVKEAAARVGYNDQFYFFSCFQTYHEVPATAVYVDKKEPGTLRHRAP